ncbi:MAG: hypothetical protein WCI73_17465, partial [Phycisphaerae bacterium]
PGYHSRIPTGTWVHPTRENFEYATMLLRYGTPADHQRAAAILQLLLKWQETRPTHATYGIWPWLVEEPLEKMAPPDWNWADFCGGWICEILQESRSKLPAAVVGQLEAALGHAARSIFRRNVGPSYTNIAIMGGGVSAAAGEMLHEKWLLDYARERLQAMVDATAHHGGFNEYNSPAYTIVVIHECERILFVVQDAIIRQHAQTLLHTAWRTIAEHFHLPTRQWAGPHARAYHDRLDAGQARLLSVRTGITIPSAEAASDSYVAKPDGHPVPCPAELLGAFRDPLPTPVTRISRFIRAADEARSTVGTTWLSGEACLGSVNKEDTWTQRRPLLAYWKTPQAQAMVLKLRFLHDGRDFASMLVRNSQKENRILSALNLATDKGDWHISLDKLGTAGFAATDLRLRYELLGPGACIKPLAPNQYALSAGAWTAVIHTLPGRFGPYEVRWQMGQEADRAWLDAVCYTGPAVRIHPETFGEITLAAGLELLRDTSPSPSGPAWLAPTASAQRVGWGDLLVETPRRPEP